MTERLRRAAEIRRTLRRATNKLMKLGEAALAARESRTAVNRDGREMEPSIEEAWRQEIARRMQDKSPGIPADVVFAELDERLNKRS